MNPSLELRIKDGQVIIIVRGPDIEDLAFGMGPDALEALIADLKDALEFLRLQAAHPELAIESETDQEERVST